MKKFVIIANKRTGSTFLQNALNSHDSITCYGELFLNKSRGSKINGKKGYQELHSKRKFSVKKYIQHVTENIKTDIFGFKIVYPQLEKWEELSRTLKNDDNWYIIHLIRKNYFNQTISYYTKGIDESKPKIKIDTNDLIDRINKAQVLDEKFQKLYKNKSQYMNIYYEDMFGKIEGKKVNIKKVGSFNIKSNQRTYLNDNCCNKICNFLGINITQMSSKLSKRNEWDVWRHIENQEEVKEKLRENGYERFI